MSGAYYGSILGVVPAVYYRKIRYVPIVGLGTAVTYAAFHASSAYFRNEV